MHAADGPPREEKISGGQADAQQDVKDEITVEAVPVDDGLQMQQPQQQQQFQQQLPLQQQLSTQQAQQYFQGPPEDTNQQAYMPSRGPRLHTSGMQGARFSRQQPQQAPLPPPPPQLQQQPHRGHPSVSRQVSQCHE